MTDKPVSVYFTAENRTFWLHGLFWGLVTFGLAFALRMVEWPCWQNPEYRLGSEWLLATHDAYHWVAGAEGFGHAVGHPMAVMLRGMADLLGTYPAAVAFWFPALLSCFVAVIGQMRGHQFQQPRPGHEGPAGDAVGLARLLGEKVLHPAPENTGPRQGHAGQHRGKEERPLLAGLHQPAGAAPPDHAQGDGGQARTGAQIPAQGLFGQGQAVEEGRQMEAVGHQALHDVAPVTGAHQVHGPVPAAEQLQIVSQPGQDRPGHRHARLPGALRQGGQGDVVVFRIGLHGPCVASGGGTCKLWRSVVKKTTLYRLPIHFWSYENDIVCIAFSRPGLAGSGHGPGAGRSPS